MREFLSFMEDLDVLGELYRKNKKCLEICEDFIDNSEKLEVNSGRI